MNNILNQFINNNITNYLSFFTSSTTNNYSEILEPFCCMIKLSLLYYKPEKTKISIINNSIIYQEPNIIQSAIRWKNGDKREHIHNLYNPIQKFLLWFKLSDPKIIYIINCAIKGLNKLLICYNTSDSVTVHSIKYYIELLEGVLNNQEIISNNELSDSCIYYIKFKKLWDEPEIDIIYKILLEIDNNNYQNIYISTIEHIINSKELIVLSIVNKLSTTL